MDDLLRLIFPLRRKTSEAVAGSEVVEEEISVGEAEEEVDSEEEEAGSEEEEVTFYFRETLIYWFL